ncbi:hypothetical protein NliqN6_0966 [Naganishia liquefaciens]|uniref:Ubiquitin-like modifier-activating enzyme ATG7 n=1 Tax=Naganishia liquefaciens TaxID=104408 RepID=A0A8H3YCS2_9TREE|nr:hypothetical protein NliqN6_0966 [Naganishia liquefaciens]
MPILQFTPLRSFPSPSFWQQLTSLKLDTLKLDDSAIDIRGWMEEGRSVYDKEQNVDLWMSGSVAVDADSLRDVVEERLHPSTIPLQGRLKNFNTIEEFRSPELKKESFNDVTKQLITSFSSTDPITTFNPFLLVSYADLKKYTYHYWFAFPALIQKPAWELVIDEEQQGDGENISLRDWNGDVEALRRMKSDAQISTEAFLYRSIVNHEQVSLESVAPVEAWWTFFQDVPEDERTLVFHDPTSAPNLPGWLLRNVLYYLAHHLPIPKGSAGKKVTSLRVIALRSGSSGTRASTSKIFRIRLPEVAGTSDVATTAVGETVPAAVGWERNSQGKLASRIADLSSTMDPKRLAEQAVDLNLKLMRWRIMPALDLEKIAGIRCLLLGAGTLGCYVARGLLGWGVRNITFVDSARVSFSNPARQPLFEFEDSLNGGKPKAAAAAEALRRIFPSVNAAGIDMSIPMPGHPVSPQAESETRDTVDRLERMIREHDAVFLLMDSRESRWLPTLIGAKENKIVINAALGFDSWLVMRHGSVEGVSAAFVGEKKRLGCYFCNDIVAPTDSLTDRTLDQMCTVTRPGIAPIAAGSACELLVSLIQHPDGINAPGENLDSMQSDISNDKRSPLGLVPHQLRGFLGQFRTMLIEGAAYDRCTGCSTKIIDEYKQNGFSMLLRAFNESDYLQKVTGLDQLYEEGEAALEAVDWDESSNEGSL